MDNPWIIRWLVGKASRPDADNPFLVGGPFVPQAWRHLCEQLTLETGHVVLVHLAPVIWRNEFLGTVSIFRDITHEVEVDRLNLIRGYRQP